MKKLISVMLSMVLMLTLSAPAFAATAVNDLNSLATLNIQVSTSTDENGATKTTFSNLDAFIDSAHSMYPDLSDYEIATFLMDYTGQQYYDLPEEEILHFLTYDNITTSTSYLLIDSEGDASLSFSDAVPYDSDLWPSPDGYMKISTSYTYRKTVGNENYFTVSARATWLKFPSVALEDAFVLGTTGTFDDDYSEYSSVSQTFNCIKCSRNTYRNRSVSQTKAVDGDLSLDYENYVPSMHFVPISPRCDYCENGGHDEYFSVYIRYGMLSDESVNLQAGYGHKTLGIGSISVGVDITGTPSFSAGLATVKSYIARPVTVSK